MAIAQKDFDERLPQGIINRYKNNENGKPETWALPAWTLAVKAGMDDKSPQSPITREQLVTLLLKLNLIPFAPGTGSISAKGIGLLKQYEYMGRDYMVYENGVLVAILSRDVEKKGNITYGYGTLFMNDPNDIKRLKDVYGLPFAEKVRTPIATCEKMMYDFFEKKNVGLHDLTSKNNMWIRQNHFDALSMHRYLRGTLGTNTVNLLKEMFANEKNRYTSAAKLRSDYESKLYNTMLGDLKMMGNWSTYGAGWTNRLKDEMELFFYGDGVRSH